MVNSQHDKNIKKAKQGEQFSSFKHILYLPENTHRKAIPHCTSA